MPSNPSDADEFNAAEDSVMDDYLEKLLGRPINTVAWLHGDHEWYPIWPTTLYEQDQIWRTKFDLRTSEDRVSRLAQEAALHVLLNDIAHDDGGD